MSWCVFPDRRTSLSSSLLESSSLSLSLVCVWSHSYSSHPRYSHNIQATAVACCIQIAETLFVQKKKKKKKCMSIKNCLSKWSSMWSITMVLWNRSCRFKNWFNISIPLLPKITTLFSWIFSLLQNNVHKTKECEVCCSLRINFSHYSITNHDTNAYTQCAVVFIICQPTISHQSKYFTWSQWYYFIYY
jgi:hypothetical protein